MAFRGTQRWDCKDWFTNLRFGNYNIADLGEVHIGFLEALGLCTREDRSTLNKARQNMVDRRDGKIDDNRETSGLLQDAVQDSDPVQNTSDEIGRAHV